ncbi:MAG: hypothetical protein DRO99_02385 [Candidatus Aenigmatarchaeota archaeon]|nr:MAG: hypothetical protein DRO99_02385 [Candidatus Aenigmarchaeota archaeon]
MEQLRKIGMTDGEVRVYSALLELGPSTTGAIVRESGISSSKVYPVLERLISMGLATYIKEGKVKIFRTTSPKRLLELIESREEEIREQKEGIKKLIPELMRRQGRRSRGHEAMVYEGYDGIRSYYNDLLKRATNGEERLVFGARTGYPIAKGVRYFFQDYHRKWSGRGLKTKIIFNSRLKGSKHARFYEDSKNTQVRYLPQFTMSSIGMHKDTIDMLVWTREGATLFVIKSKEVARTFMNYFNVLWKSAE